MSRLSSIQQAIRAVGRPERVALYQRFFQTAPGQYGEGDRFVAARVPDLRTIAKRYASGLELPEIEELLHSPIHEERFVALVILTDHFERERTPRQAIVDLYLRNTSYINNWDLVDVSAHKIIGTHTLAKPFPFLSDLAQSTLVWDRRIAVIATLMHSKHKNPVPILTLAELLLPDPHPLIHKAVGWMLREMGKHCGRSTLTKFLDENAPAMPRTMLRYAIEQLPKEEQRHYLNLPR